MVWRASRAENHHRSSDSAYWVGEDTFDNMAINYLSFVQPVRWWDRNFVFSLNYQEDYDFTHRFQADSRNGSTSSSKSRAAETFAETTTASYEEPSSVYPGGVTRINVTSDMTTRQQSDLRELIVSRLASPITFEQEGVIDAITLAGAAEITPSFTLGAAFNIHGDNTLGGNPIRSRTTASYTGTSLSEARRNIGRVTTGTYTYDGVVSIPPGGMIPFPIEVPISGSGDYDPINEDTTQASKGSLAVSGEYEEVNEFNDLSGYSGTFGAHWTTCRFLTLGFALDLPWTADAEQHQTLRNRMTTTVVDDSGVRKTSTTETVEEKTRSVEFDFPLYASLGALMRWTDRFYTTLDVSQTQWSEFVYRAEGQEAMNPLDGSPQGLHEMDDCWAVRQGAEYLWTTRVADIALRGGAFWEQRPAVGTPDNYFGWSLGTGLSFGKERHLIVDVAWLHTLGNDVMGSLVPGQQGLTTDVAYDELYVSAIWHF